jgi:hypothetical protein
VTTEIWTIQQSKETRALNKARMICQINVTINFAIETLNISIYH